MTEYMSDGPPEWDPGEPPIGHDEVPFISDVTEDELVENPYFKVLGSGGNRIYVYQKEKEAITDRPEADWPESALTSIAPLNWWEVHFPGRNGMNKKLAVNWLQRTALRLNFDPAACRGRGAWKDGSRIVFHAGDRLIVDGLRVPLKGLRESRFVYGRTRPLNPPAEEGAHSSESRLIYDALKEFGWTRPASAILLTGWIALAPIAGVLRWRPHVWITGGAGSGKTTLLNLINSVLNDNTLYVNGNSTEAGIRQSLGSDALPVLFDESEQNNEREVMRVQNILSLVRQASTESGARTLKGTQSGTAIDFLIRSMFCFASIQVGMHHQADLERVSVLKLQSSKQAADNGADSGERWGRAVEAIHRLKADGELPARLLTRALMLLPVTLRNIDVFVEEAARHFGSRRDGDQYGTLLAGAWSLSFAREATPEDARALIARHDWSEYVEQVEGEDSDKALSALLEAKLRDGATEFSVYEVLAAAGRWPDQPEKMLDDDAIALLRRHGMTIKEDGGERLFCISRTSRHPARLLRDTPYSVDLHNLLVRLPNAVRVANVWTSGSNSRGVGIPLADIRRGGR